MTDAERQRRYRDRVRGGPPREPRPCGTLAAYKRHQRNGEPIDDACREANAAYQRDYQQRRKALWAEGRDSAYYDQWKGSNQ